MRPRLLFKHSFMLLGVVLAALFSVGATVAQSTSFTYQGRLTDGGTAANGNYDLQFALWDSLSGGGQVGSTQTLNTVAVSSGVFTVSLDFGANAFPGASRFLEISARPSGAGSFTLLTPRQPITSTPYAVRSLNATTADSVPASGVPAGSGNYIQNSSSPQTANFNISGNGTTGGTLSGNLVNATTQFNLNGSRILSAGPQSLFAGIGAGQSNTGSFNSFFGFNTGQANTSGGENSFFGTSAGRSNTVGSANAFFGDSAGFQNTVGGGNAFFGSLAGENNTMGGSNSFFGFAAGESNTTGNNNSFFGDRAGIRATGSGNTFVGVEADFANVVDISPSGSSNTLLGIRAALGSGGMFSPNNATAIGAQARVDQSNSLVLGSIKNVNGAAADTNVGIGTTAPQSRLHVVGTTGLMGNVGIGNTSPTRLFHLVGSGSNSAGFGDLLVSGTGTIGAAITFDSRGATGGRAYSWISTANSADAGGGKLAAFDVTAGAYRMVIDSAGNVGIGTTTPADRLDVNGDIRVGTSGTNGCLKRNDGTFIVGSCSSDVRFKRDISPFPGLLNKVTQLRPVHYYWRATEFPEKGFGNAQAYGLVAQEVEKVLPELVGEDQQGFKTVDYSKLPLMLLQAVKEQQAQIATLQRVNSALNARLHKVERALRNKSSARHR